RCSQAVPLGTRCRHRALFPPASPMHSLPPCSGTGLLHSRMRLFKPPPHVAEQAAHRDRRHPPPTPPHTHTRTHTHPQPTTKHTDTYIHTHTHTHTHTHSTRSCRSLCVH